MKNKEHEITKTPAGSLSKDMLELCLRVEARRPRTVIEHILKHGIITTEELSTLYGYDHPPRAIRDVRENGIPLETHKVISSKTGRRVGAYTFDDISRMKAGRVGGRKAFSKAFKQDLINRYGSRDTITRQPLDERYLQIDHRVPYEVAGDENGPLDLCEYMLLDASSNRAKSWSCESCENFKTKRLPAICKSCFWASPEAYTHIAETPARRVELVWSGAEVEIFDRLKKAAAISGVDITEYIKRRLSE